MTFRGVTKRFAQKTAVQDLTITMEAGTVNALLGPNGAGKTTSISMMLGLIRPSRGEVRVFGMDPTRRDAKQRIGAMLQQVGLPPQSSVREVLALFSSYYRDPLPVNTLLHLADLEAESKRSAVKLSGGQKRRLQFALAMAGNPELLFLDEPTTAMDVGSRRLFWERLREFAGDKRKTIVMTTHHLEEADAIADRIIFMHQGRTVADGTSASIKSMAGYRYVSFRVGEQVTDEALRNLPAADHVEWHGRHVRIRTQDSDAVLRGAIHEQLDVSQFEVSAGGLEDAFLALTSEGA